MRTKKLGRTLLLACIVAIIFLVLFMQQKSRVIASQQREISQLEYRDELEKEIIQGDQTIIYLREKKKQNCEILGSGMSISLIATCGLPK